MSNFQPLEVVGRGSETQLLVDEKVLMNHFIKWNNCLLFWK